MYISQASRGKSSILNLLIGLLILLGVNVLFSALFSLLFVIRGEAQPNISILTSDPLYLFLVLMIFISLIVGVWCALRWVHKRPFGSVLTSGGSFRWRRGLLGFMAILLPMVVLTVAQYLMDDTYVVFNPNWTDLVYFLPALFVGLLIQTTAEELTFRGYLLQEIGWLTHSRVWGIILSSILFASLHAYNPEFLEANWAVLILTYLLIAVFFACVTVMDDGIELAMGMHYANNFFAFAFLNYPNAAINTPSVFKASELDDSWIGLLGSSIWFVIIFWFLSKFLRWEKANKLIQKPVASPQTPIKEPSEISDDIV